MDKYEKRQLRAFLDINKTLSLGFKTYKDLVGKTVRLTINHNYYWDSAAEEQRLYIQELEYYPWGSCISVNAVVLEDHPNFIDVLILPHQNPEGYDISKPYRHSINKWNIGKLFRIEEIK